LSPVTCVQNTLDTFNRPICVFIETVWIYLEFMFMAILYKRCLLLGISC